MSTKAAPETKPTSAPPARGLTRTRAPRLLRASCSCGKPITDRGECAECQQKRLQRSRAGGAPSTVPASVQSVLRSDGSPLEAPTRTEMESRFGHDFSQVRVHTDASAGESAREVNAHAYTVGQDIAFAPGQYDPYSAPGRQLLAHELAHTVQQSGLQRSPAGVSVDEGPEYQQLESEAASAATAVMQGAPVALTRPASRPILSKAPATAVPPGTSQPGGSIPVIVDTPSYFGKTTHFVTAEKGTAAGGAKGASFVVDKLYIPAAKGAKGAQRYDELAKGGVLQSVVGLAGNASAAAWQLRDPPPTLRTTWLQARNLTPGPAADKAWAEAGGAATFPLCGTGACQIDHIVELQTTGGNNAENLQPLDGPRNSDSGQALWNEVSGLARAIEKEPQLSAGGAGQVRLKFQAAEMKGTAKFAAPETAAPTANAAGIKRGTTCLSIGQAMTDNAGKGATAGGSIPGAKPTTPYGIAAKASAATSGGSSTTIQVLGTVPLTSDVDIYKDPANEAAGQLISGLLLEKLKKGSGPDGGHIAATLDTRSSGKKKTKLPISLEGASSAVDLNVAKQAEGGRLSLAKPSVDLQFTYPFLSNGKVTKMEVTPEGETNWSGYITPRVKFLGKLDVSYTNGELRVVKGLDKIKSPFPGIAVTKAEVAMQLGPEFVPSGTIQVELRPGGSLLAKGEIIVSKDDKGLAMKGTLDIFIPGVSGAQLNALYSGGEWSGEAKIESSKINLPYVKSGSLTARINGKDGLGIDGEVQAELPGGNLVTLGASRAKSGKWMFTGKGVLKVPKLDDVNVNVSFDGETLTATGSTSFTFHELKGTLERVTYQAKKGEPGKITGKGKLAIKKGKVDGNMEIALSDKGRFTGKGSVTYQITEKITAQAGVVVDEQEKVRFDAALKIAEIKLFEGVKGEKNLFNIEKNIPIPGASIGPVGVQAKIGGGVDIGYGLGPGALKHIVIEAKFNPLEKDPDIDAHMGARLEIPAYAKIGGYIKGGIALSAVIAEASGGITISASLTLQGGIAANFDGRYSKHRFEVNASAEIFAALILGLGLKAWVLARAGVPPFSVDTRKDWDLAKLDVPTGIDFKLKAPIRYVSDQPFKAPSLSDIEWSPPPKIDPGDLLQRIFAAATANEKKAA